jgi:hypothetical protein
VLSELTRVRSLQRWGIVSWTIFRVTDSLRVVRAHVCARFAEVRHCKLDDFQSDRLSWCCQSSRVCAVCRGETHQTGLFQANISSCYHLHVCAICRGVASHASFLKDISFTRYLQRCKQLICGNSYVVKSVVPSARS